MGASLPIPEQSLCETPILVIGAGGIVRDAHLPAYWKAGFTVAGIYDLDVQKARVLAAAFQIPRVYTALEEVVRCVPSDAIFDLAVPASAHLSVLEQLPVGSAVLIQKPMGGDLQQAHAIRELCRARRLTAAVNFQLRFAPYIVAARRLVEEGIIGELHDLEVRVTVDTPWHQWSFLEHCPRVEILYHSIHYIDLTRSFLGEPQGIYAKTVKHPRFPVQASTRSSIILDYGEMRRATITTNHGHYFGVRHQESYVKWEGTRGAIKATMGLLLDYPRGAADSLEYCASGEDWKSVPFDGTWFPDAFIGIMASLMRFRKGSSTELPTSVEDAFKTMAVVEAAYRSSSEGGTPVPSCALS